MNKKNILVLPGTLWQVQLVKTIKEMGHKAYVVHPSPDSPCLPYADGFLEEDIFHNDEIIKYGRQHCIDAVMSDECDIAMPLIASYSNQLGAISIDSSSAYLYTNKYAMREFCKLHGLKTPEYRLCKTIEDTVSFLKEMKKPIILKPLDSNASHGIHKVSTEKEIYEKFLETISFSRGEKAILAERFIEGTEFTVDGIKTCSSHYTLAISQKKHYKHNINIANELYFSHFNRCFDYKKLKSINDDFVLKSNLPYGLTHAEYKYENGDFYLIEIAARGGGNMISSVITQFMSGYNTYHYLIDCYTTGAYEKDFSIPSSHTNRVAILKFFETPSNGGIVESIKGIDYLQNTKSIVFFKLNFKIGDLIVNAPNDSARIGFYIACAESEEQLKKTVETVNKEFKITTSKSF